MFLNEVLFGMQVVVFMTLMSWMAIKSPNLRTTLTRVVVMMIALIVFVFTHIDQVLTSLVVCVIALTFLRLYDMLMPVVVLAVSSLDRTVQYGPEKPKDLYRNLVWYKREYDDDIEFEEWELADIHSPSSMDRIALLFKMEIFDYYFKILFYCFVSLITLFVIATMAKFFRRFLVNRMRRQYQEITEAIELSSFVPEKFAPGSSFIDIKDNQLPGCQASVLVSTGGGPFVYAGQAFRVDDKIYTAWHVISSAEEVKLHTPRSDKFHLVPKESFSVVHGDIAVADLDVNTLSKLGLSSAKFSQASISGINQISAFVEIHAMNKKSMGLLTPHDSFSYVTYSGSTIGGFSGAPYLVNKTVYGMHIGHQSVNLGYDGAFLSLLHDAAMVNGKRIVNESTVDFLFDAFKKRGKKSFKFSRSPYDPDEYFVRLDGKYYQVSEDDIHRMQGLVFDDQFGWISKEDEILFNRESALENTVVSVISDMVEDGVLAPRDLVYKDSGNGLQASTSNFASVGADGHASLAHVVVPTNVMQKLYPTPSSGFPTQLNNLVTQLPASMPVQQSVASSSTQKDPTSDQTIDLTRVTLETRQALEKRRLKLKQRKERKKLQNRQSNNISTLSREPLASTVSGVSQ